MKKIIISLFLAFGLLSLHAQTKLVEKVVAEPGEVVIPYEKYLLDNGLTLIVHEDHSDPLVHVDVTYHVGSAREEIGKSGFAHFFEHMMFQGSDNVADEQHFKIISEAGGTLNGTTNRDRTNYFETAPSNQLETLLWLESDRMGFLLDAVTQGKFEVQRETVKNEKGQNYDNRPYGRRSEINAKALYPYGHPYSWLTIGILEDLDRVDVDDLKKFFMRWYGPNNATITIGGDVKPADAVAAVEKYFGNIARGSNVEVMKLAPVKLDKNRYISYFDNLIRFPMLQITYPTVPRHHPDEAPLDCLADILGGGKSSYFYKRFVQTQKAVQTNVSHPASELAGEFTMIVLPFPGQALSDFEKEVYDAINDFEKEGVTEEDVNKFKSTIESSIINGLATVSGKVSQLASFETFLGNPNYTKEDLRRYSSISKEDVIRVYNKYIKGQKAVILSVLASEDELPAQADNFVASSSETNPFPVTDYSGLSYTKPVDNFDRSEQPIPGKSPLVQVPEFWTSKMKNGIKIIGTKSSEIPTIALQLSINGGHRLDALDITKSGLANLTASMLNESTQNYSGEAISKELEKLGSSISVSANDNSIAISLRSLSKNIDKTIELLEEKLFKPKFSKEDFERVKKQSVEGAIASEKQPVPIANNVYHRLLYGESHIMSTPSSGTEESIGSITLADVKGFYETYFSPTVSELVVVGDVDKKAILKKLDFLKKWPAKPVSIPSIQVDNSIDKTKIYLVNVDKAPQSEIRVGYMTDLKYDVTGNYFKSTLMNYTLGGAFNSRINLNLREDKGYTYGAWSYFRSNDYPGPYTAQSGVRGNVTDSALVEMMDEITHFQKDGITNEELSFMKGSIGQRDARSYEAPWQKTSFLGRILHYDLDKSYVNEQNKIINEITQNEINLLAKKNLPVDKMIIVVVGDKKSIKPGLEKIGYEVVELDSRGNEVEQEMKQELKKE